MKPLFEGLNDLRLTSAPPPVDKHEPMCTEPSNLHPKPSARCPYCRGYRQARRDIAKWLRGLGPNVLANDLASFASLANDLLARNPWWGE